MLHLAQELRAEHADIDLRIAKPADEWSGGIADEILFELLINWNILDLFNVFVFNFLEVHGGLVFECIIRAFNFQQIC